MITLLRVYHNRFTSLMKLCKIEAVRNIVARLMDRNTNVLAYLRASMIISALNQLLAALACSELVHHFSIKHIFVCLFGFY